jgi:fatty-acyl-CoA synthase
MTEVEQKIIEITHTLLKELGNNRPKEVITLNAILDKDLGLGSLERVELFSRIKDVFNIELSEEILLSAETIKDLVTAVTTAPHEIKDKQREEKRKMTSAMQSASIPVGVETLVDVLRHYADLDPERPHIYLRDEYANEEIITYGALLEKSQQVARGLCGYGLKEKETVSLMLPTSKDFFFAFFGILLAGGIPVPIYPPFRLDRLEEYAEKEASILKNAGVRILITNQQIEILANRLKPFVPSLIATVTISDLTSNSGTLPTLQLRSENPALIQYTSGSTGLPKGVLLTHGNLLSNMKAFGQAIQPQPTDVTVSWLPLYHDMGLIGAWLGSLSFGIPTVIMSPLTFLADPSRWLWAIHAHRGTISAGPNFAYELCVNKIKDSDIEGLDLSSWRLAFNGAEAIYAKTLERFTNKFISFGFKPETLFPVYGLAESTVALAFPKPGNPPRIDKVDRLILEKNKEAIPIKSDENNINILEFVSCGYAIPDHKIRIVDEKNELLPERKIGRLQFRGPSTMKEYYRNPQATNEIFHNGWCDSGDFAYIANGEVFITGRKKDVIIKAGRNIYPHSIEEITGQIPGIRKGCVIAFGASDSQSGTEKLVIVAETKEKNIQIQQQLYGKITETVTTEIGIPPDQIIFVAPGIVPKTSSGKLQRSTCKEMYLKNQLTKHRLPIWFQLSKLYIKGLKEKINKGFRKIFNFFYGIYLYFIVLLLFPIVWLSALILSSRQTAKFCQKMAKLFFRLATCSVSVIGKENLQKFPSYIIVANHFSYIDSLLLLSILPIDIIFVGKKELLQTSFIKTIFKKLNYLTVDRLDFSRNLEDSKLIEEMVKQNHSVMIFPEGTFKDERGLLPFKLGAFKIAADTNTPLLPISIEGARHILRGDHFWPHRGDIKITISEPIIPINTDWQEVLRLSNEARKQIAKYCGEQVID